MNEPSEEVEELFCLVFPGNILPGSDHDEVVLELSRLLKTPTESASRLISGKRRYVKKTFAFDKAKQLQAEVVQLGVECEIESVGEVKKPSTRRNKGRHKEDFPDPEDVLMQIDSDERESPETGTHTENMAELQLFARGTNKENPQTETDRVSAMDSAPEQVPEKLNIVQQALRRRLAIFVADSLDDYMPAFDKFLRGEQPHFVFTWHWPALFVPFLWAVYRKCWGWSVIIFISSIFFPLSNLLWALTIKYLYFKHGQRKIIKIRKIFPPDEVDEQLTEAGGTSSKALAVAVLVILISMTGLYWTGKLSPVFSTLNENLQRIEQSKESQHW